MLIMKLIGMKVNWNCISHVSVSYQINVAVIMLSVAMAFRRQSSYKFLMLNDHWKVNVSNFQQAVRKTIEECWHIRKNTTGTRVKKKMSHTRTIKQRYDLALKTVNYLLIFKDTAIYLIIYILNWHSQSNVVD